MPRLPAAVALFALAFLAAARGADAELYESSAFFASKDCSGPVEYLVVGAMTDAGNATTCAEHEAVHVPKCAADADGHSVFVSCTDSLQPVLPKGYAAEFMVGTLFDGPGCGDGTAEEIHALPAGACTALEGATAEGNFYARANCASESIAFYTDAACTKPTGNITTLAANGTCAPFPLVHANDSIQFECRTLGAKLYENTVFYNGKNCTGNIELIYVNAMTDGGNATTCAEHDTVHPSTCEPDADGHSSRTTCTQDLELVVPAGASGQFAVGTLYEGRSCPEGGAEQVMALPSGACTALGDNSIAANGFYAKADCAAGTVAVFTNSACTVPVGNVSAVPTTDVCTGFPLFHSDDAIRFVCRELAPTLHESSAYFAGKNCTGAVEFIFVSEMTDAGNATTCAEHAKEDPSVCETDADGHSYISTCTERLELVVPPSASGQWAVGTVYGDVGCHPGTVEHILAVPSGGCVALEDPDLPGTFYAKGDCTARTVAFYTDSKCSAAVSNVTTISTLGFCTGFPLHHVEDSVQFTCKSLGSPTTSTVAPTATATATVSTSKPASAGRLGTGAVGAVIGAAAAAFAVLV
ncbi:hypothetical protein DFJ74DRAFT_702057 [Hyaloraphidium curvatum]|nr:hypothetical protein DFJ74DRAFT_702057 [Hyaloraphidium curvatum]